MPVTRSFASDAPEPMPERGVVVREPNSYSERTSDRIIRRMHHCRTDA